MRAGHALALGLAALAACAGVPPAATRRPVLPTAPPAAAPPPKPSLVVEPAGDSRSEDEVTSASPAPPYAGRVEPVPLPAGTRRLVGVTGRSSSDVWMLADGGAVFRWNGTTVTPQGSASCFVDACCGRLFDCKRWPSKCTRAAAEECGFGRGDCARAVEFSWISTTPGDVRVHGTVDTGGLRSAYVAARLGRDGRWRCEQPEDDLVRPGELTVVVDGTTITLETPAWLVNPLGTASLLWAGRRVPLPEEARTALDLDLVATALDEVWVWRLTGGVWACDGLSWTSRPTGLQRLVALWPGEPGSVWALGGELDEAQAAGELRRWDVDARAWRRFPTPAGFRASRVLPSGARGAWLLGGEGFYHLDGSALHRADSPLALGDAWLGPGGELWVVGAARANVAEGAAFRVVAR